MDSGYVFKVLSTEELKREMLRTIKEINLILEMPPFVLYNMLKYFKFDRRKFLNKFFDGNKDLLFNEVEIGNPCDVESRKGLRLTSSAHQKCGICFNHLPSSLMTIFDCDNIVCTDCWSTYFTTKIMEGAPYGCRFLVKKFDIIIFVENIEMRLKLEKNIFNDLIDTNNLL